MLHPSHHSKTTFRHFTLSNARAVELRVILNKWVCLSNEHNYHSGSTRNAYVNITFDVCRVPLPRVSVTCLQPNQRIIQTRRLEFQNVFEIQTKHIALVRISNKANDNFAGMTTQTVVYTSVFCAPNMLLCDAILCRQYWRLWRSFSSLA